MSEYFIVAPTGTQQSCGQHPLGGLRVNVRLYGGGGEVFNTHLSGVLFVLYSFKNRIVSRTYFVLL